SFARAVPFVQNGTDVVQVPRNVGMRRIAVNDTIRIQGVLVKPDGFVVVREAVIGRAELIATVRQNRLPLVMLHLFRILDRSLEEWNGIAPLIIEHEDVAAALIV